MQGPRAHVLQVRLSGSQWADLQAQAASAGMTISDYTRSQLGLSFMEANDMGDRLDEYERRLSRLEEMAGL